MSLTMRVRHNKYHDLKPSEQKQTSGQRQRRRVRERFALWHQMMWPGRPVEDVYAAGCSVGHFRAPTGIAGIACDDTEDAA